LIIDLEQCWEGRGQICDIMIKEISKMAMLTWQKGEGQKIHKIA
jgi:hypothetical protein